MIYVHVPFCCSFCTYCDFYSETACSGENFNAWADAVIAEIGSRRGEIERTLGKNTLYIGGGTPSVLPFACLKRVVGAIAEATSAEPLSEFTVEVNPEDIVRKGVEYVRELRSIGVDRVSMGVQSLDDGILRWMRRRHDADRARNAFRILREGGIANISVDLIIGVSQMTDEVLESTLGEILTWRPEHISAYQLSIEEGSALARMCREGLYVEASDEQFRKQYLIVCEHLREAGYEHYEISNWALPGFRAEHNSAYWRRLPYVGLGPGAHSLRFETTADIQRPPIHPDKPDGNSTPAAGSPRQIRSWNSETLSGWTSGSEVLTPEEIREEEIMLGLRTSEGWNGRRLTEEEWLVSDSIIADLL